MIRKWSPCRAAAVRLPNPMRLPLLTPMHQPGSDLNKGLRELVTADSSFDPKEFWRRHHGLRDDRVRLCRWRPQDLKSLLSREVFDGFVAAIDEREARGETVRSNFVGIEKANIIQAEMKGTEANVTLRIISQLISATLDKDGRGG
jgi:predicted lipid-binding transport protein (Tim44 family)